MAGLQSRSNHRRGQMGKAWSEFGDTGVCRLCSVGETRHFDRPTTTGYLKRGKRLVRYIADDENEDDSSTIYESAANAHLALLVKGRISQSFPLRGEIKLGREKDNTIVVADQKVSRHHATLRSINDTFIIHDEGSANGTYVNGVLIAQPTRLQNDDRVSLGDTTFLFTTGQPSRTTVDPPIATPVAPPPPLTQPVIQSSVPTATANNRPIWLVIGCMAVAIVTLLVVLALMFGLFWGSGQVGLSLMWLTGVI